MSDESKRDGGGIILIAEDNETNQMVIKAILNRKGHPYRIATDGLEALAQYEANQIDLILMDCQMPNLDGLQTTREIRSRELKSGASRCPIIALTANAMSGDKERCLEAGMDDFLAKPFRSHELLAKIETWIVPRKPQGER